jgi:hypothetical protein
MMKPFAPTTTALQLVDPEIAAMVAKSDPGGAIFMLVLVVSFWEVVTPGRQPVKPAKK